MEHLVFWIGGIVFSLCGLIVPFIFKELYDRIKKLEKQKEDSRVDIAVMVEQMKEMNNSLKSIRSLVIDLPCKDVCKFFKGRMGENGEEEKET